jgi:hypothetical protein
MALERIQSQRYAASCGLVQIETHRIADAAAAAAAAAREAAGVYQTPVDAAGEAAEVY